MFRHFFHSFLLVGLLSMSVAAEVPRSYIFRLEVQRLAGETIELTGFKVAGRPGIYTALHGVSSGTVVAILPSKAKRIPVKLVEASVERDIAYLLPKSTSTPLPKGGLNSGLPSDLQQLAKKEVRVIGFPINIDLLASETKLTVRDRAVEPLEDIVNPQARAEIRKRQSPSLVTSVLNLQGNLLPGHSGAPVFDDENTVVGIASGGLARGLAGHCWAIPFHPLNIELRNIKDPKISETLVALQRLPASSNLFCIVDEDAKTQTVRLNIKTQTVVRSADGTQVRINAKRPSEGVQTGINLLQQAIKDLKSGESTVKPEDAARIMFVEMGFWVPSGTSVKIIANRGEQNSPKDPFGSIEKMLANGPSQRNPFEVLGTLADGVNVKVKVIEGEHKGKDGWVFSDAITSVTTATQR